MADLKIPAGAIKKVEASVKGSINNTDHTKGTEFQILLQKDGDEFNLAMEDFYGKGSMFAVLRHGENYSKAMPVSERSESQIEEITSVLHSQELEAEDLGNDLVAVTTKLQLSGTGKFRAAK